ncbi:hypothetical protein HC028_19455 [Planosporangium flavigriseum]|uniref:Uncharacterized protein n=1 Tax=Planosporangium flavigriseum TaxID=373681 RepID=A0A8J3PPT3_9ACTN|nr:hypothetical protein [Planosporangium flavigriseum]NJC66666.1 hypothetical protein [Planosporangium flavigriseum]GIG76699.1 hypothetical protein Pfl04_51030 [Planosporangium flavigriseum]
MGTYTGLATLVLPDSTREQGVVALRSKRTESSPVQSWSGTFRPDDPSADFSSALGSALPLELPIGSTGEVLLEGVEGAGSDTAVRLVGSGPPPF